jgi:F0F1-type ATP synthase assembly protein I
MMKKRRWPRSFVRPTEEYVGGILTGLGWGILLTGYILFRRNIFELGELALVGFGFALIPIGASIARHGQHRKENSQDQDREEKESTPSPRLQ